MLLSVVESVHTAPLSHGELAHSSTSTSQMPSSATPHSALYCEMKSYAHTPLAKPATHTHEKAAALIESPVAVVPADSEQPAPFAQGADAHSSMSILHVPPSATVHVEAYCAATAVAAFQPTAHRPSAKPSAQAHEYMSTGIVGFALTVPSGLTLEYTVQNDEVSVEIPTPSG